jgi:DNA-binding transcriptional ArsR family regulator
MAGRRTGLLAPGNRSAAPSRELSVTPSGQRPLGACSFLHPGHSGGTAPASHRTSLDHRPYVRGRVYPPGAGCLAGSCAHLVTTFEVKQLISIPTLANKFLNALSVWAVPARRKSAHMASQGEDSKRSKGDEGTRKRKPQLSEEARRARAARRRERAEGRSRVQMILAIAHPLRRRMLRMIVKQGEPLSPAQMAREFGLPVGTITYHAKVLWHFEAVEPIRDPQAAGAAEHRYEATIENDPPIETLLEETREADEGGADVGEDA